VWTGDSDSAYGQIAWTCLQLCLLAKCMKPALQFLDVDITDISKEVRFHSNAFYIIQLGLV